MKFTKSRNRSITLTGVAAATSIALTLSGCSSSTTAEAPAEHAVIAADTSKSAESQIAIYQAGIRGWAGSHTPLTVDLVALDGTAGSTQCPRTQKTLEGTGNNDAVREDDLTAKLNQFIATTTTWFACQHANPGPGGSDLLAFSTISSALGGHGTAVLFTDGMITNPVRAGEAIKSDDALAVAVAGLGTGDELSGINVEIYGAGSGSRALTDEQFSRLQQLWTAAVSKRGGTLTTFSNQMPPAGPVADA